MPRQYPPSGWNAIIAFVPLRVTLIEGIPCKDKRVSLIDAKALNLYKQKPIVYRYFSSLYSRNRIRNLRKVFPTSPWSYSNRHVIVSSRLSWRRRITKIHPSWVPYYYRFDHRTSARLTLLYFTCLHHSPYLQSWEPSASTAVPTPRRLFVRLLHSIPDYAERALFDHWLIGDEIVGAKQFIEFPKMSIKRVFLYHTKIFVSVSTQYINGNVGSSIPKKGFVPQARRDSTSWYILDDQSKSCDCFTADCVSSGWKFYTGHDI